jgi:hypothetical protein
MIATIHSFSLKNKASGVVVDPCNDQLRNIARVPAVE